MDKKELTTYQPPQSDKKTLKTLEGRDKAEKYEQSKIGVKMMDAASIHQLSSSGKAA